MLGAMVTLGEVLEQRRRFVEIDDSQTYKRCRVRLHAQGIVLRDSVLGAEVKTKRQQLCATDDFLVAEIDAKVGGFGVVPRELDGAIVSSHYFAYEIDRARLDPRYLGLVSGAALFQEQVRAQGSTNYAAIRPGDVLSYEVPLPPLLRQQELVDWVHRLERSVRLAREAKDKVREGLAALAASSAGAVFTRLETRGWPVVELGAVAEIRSGVTLGRTLTGETATLPYLRVANVQDGRLDLREIKEVVILKTERDKWLLRWGDVLLTEGGDWDKLGRGTVWLDEISPCIHQNHIFRLRTDASELDPTFLSEQLRSPRGKAYFRSASKQTTNLASINQRQLRAFPVIKPPLSVQRGALEQLRRVSEDLVRLKAASERQAREVEAVRPSVMHRLFGSNLQAQSP